MFRKLQYALLIAVPLLWGSCASIHEDLDPCEVYLEFVYDYNMEFTCSFREKVGTVDVFVFDGQGRYLFTKQAECATQLIGGNRMLLSNDLEFGDYNIFTVGGLSSHFRVSDLLGSAPVVGQTTVEEMQIALDRRSDEVSHEFPAMWVGPAIAVSYTPGNRDHVVWKVPTIKDTNVFHISLAAASAANTMDSRAETVDAPSPYTFKIVIPQGAVYGYDNAPLSDETVTYRPYLLGPGTDPGNLWTAKINTTRLFDEKNSGYNFAILNASTGEEVWSYDLIYLLEQTMPKNLPVKLTMQEYLDRESEWNLVIYYNNNGPGDDGFVAIGVKVNGWIIWFNDLGV